MRCVRSSILYWTLVALKPRKLNKTEHYKTTMTLSTLSYELSKDIGKNNSRQTRTLVLKASFGKLS